MLVICVITMFFALWTGYMISVYSLAVYIDPDKVQNLKPGVSARRQRILSRLAGDPLAFVQVSTVYRSFALILITVCAAFILDLLAASLGLNSYYLYPVGMVCVWLLYILFVEYLPRRFSRRAVGRGVPRFFWLIAFMYVVFSPVVTLYRSALSRVNDQHRVTEEEKEEIVERAIETLAEQAGIGEQIVEEDEKEMIGQIFLLDQTLVREIMSPRIDIAAIERTTRFTQIQELVRSDGHSRYPVYDDTIDKVIGVLYVKDLFSNMPAPGEEFVISDYLRKPFFVPESKVIGELLREFKTKQLHIAIVVDEYGGVAGLVTLEDILEEIVGEIQDEHDSEEADWRSLSDGHFMADAGLRVEKMQDYLDIEYEQGEYDTIGGLIYDLVGSVPSEGARVKWHSVEFEIVEVDGQRIKKVKVYQHPT